MNYFILIQTIVAYTVAIASLFGIYKIMDAYLKQKLKLETNNMAISLFQLGILLSTANVLSSVVSPSMNAVRFLNQSSIDVTTIAISVAYIVGFVFVGLLASILTIFGSVGIYFQLTDEDEWTELKNDNLKTAIVTSALILGISIVIKDYIGHLCEALIPYPEIQFIG